MWHFNKTDETNSKRHNEWVKAGKLITSGTMGSIVSSDYKTREYIEYGYTLVQTLIMKNILV